MITNLNQAFNYRPYCPLCHQSTKQVRANFHGKWYDGGVVVRHDQSFDIVFNLDSRRLGPGATQQQAKLIIDGSNNSFIIHFNNYDDYVPMSFIRQCQKMRIACHLNISCLSCAWGFKVSFDINYKTGTIEHITPTF